MKNRESSKPPVRFPMLGKTIRNRLLLGLLFAGLLPIAILLIVTQTITSRAITKSEYEKIYEIARGAAQSVESTLDGAWNNLKNLSSNPTLNDPSVSEEQNNKVRAEFERVVRSYSHFTDITLLEKDTRKERKEEQGGYPVVSKSGGNPDQDQTTWLKDASKGQILVAGPNVPPYANSVALEVTYYIPVGPEGLEPSKYVVRAEFDFSGTIWALLHQARFGKTGRFLLVDENHNLLFHPDIDRVFNEKFDEETNLSQWAMRSDGERGDDLYVAQLIPKSKSRLSTDLYLIALESKEEARDLVRQSNEYLILAGILTLLAAGLLGLLLSNKISGPITKLSRATRNIARGQLQTSIPEEGPIELRHLARDFNQMVEELKDHREELESLVQERTQNLRQSQEQLADLTAQLRASYDSTQEAIVVVKTDGKVLTANRRFLEMFDIDDVDGLTVGDLQKEMRDCFVENSDFASHWQLCNESLSIVEEEEWAVSKPREMVVSIYSAPVKNASNVTFARLWMFRDLTEQRQLENGLRQAQKMEAIGRLAGGVAHDFNNLLTGIIGNLSLVQMNEGIDQAKVDKLVASAKHAGQRAAELVKQLLGFSRLSHLKIQKCRVNEIAEEVRDLLVHSIDPGIQIVLELDDELWSVSADPNQVQQVIMNMAVNAKDAIGEAKGRIRIASSNLEIDEFHASLVNDANPGDYVRISVEDTGSGMSSEVRSKIFEPFFTTKEQGKGTGLGLATSYGIIQQHGGWISCDSEEDVGTTFHIYLPRGASDEQETSDMIEDSKPVMGGTETVLLVDDELVVRMVGEGVLKHHGYRIITADDGEDALAKLEEYQDEISVMMLDLTMPKLSGRETFRRLRAGQYKQIPVVVCSGYLVDLEEFAEETGAKPEGFVQKPYDSEELARTIRRVIDEAPCIV